MPLALTRPDILKWMHLFVLAVGLNCGNFSIERLLPFIASWPDQFSQIRYLCIPVLLVLTLVRRPINLGANLRVKDALASMGVLGIFLLYGLTSLPASESFLYSYNQFEPYFMVFVYGMLTMLACRDAADAEFFLKSTLAILMGVLGLYIVFELITEPHAFATGYYYSRMFYIGFIVALMFLFRSLDRAHRVTMIWMSLAAILFLFAGVATAMRTSVLLYSLSILAIIPLLLALRSYGRLGLIILITAIAFTFGFAISAKTIVIKMNAYSPFISQTYTQEMTQLPEELAQQKEDCQKRIDDLAYETREKIAASAYSCLAMVSIRDVDARIRMLMQALHSVESPWFGNGLGTYSFADAARSTSPAQLYKYPHNIYVELYNETGLVGLFLIGLSILFVFSVCTRTALAENPSTIGLLCLIPVFFMLSGGVAGDFYDARYIWILPFIMTAMMSGKRLESEGHKNIVASQ